MKFTEHAVSIVTGFVAKHEEISRDIANLRKQYSDSLITGKVMDEKIFELTQMKDAAMKAAIAEMEEINGKYRVAAEARNLVDGSMIHEDAKLLAPGFITLTASQFTALVKKHRDNPLMAQLLQQYQKEHEGLYADYVPSVDQRISDFNGFVRSGISSIQNPESIQAAMFQSGRYTPASVTEEE